MGVRNRIEFPAGHCSTSVFGEVARGDQDSYWLGGKNGQCVSVSVQDNQNNAAFSLFDTSAHPPAPMTVDGYDTCVWAGTFPCDGDILIRVGAKAGSTGYHLIVSITDAPEPVPASL